MVPVVGSTTIGGIPVANLLPASKLNQIVKRTQDGGAEIVNLLKTGSAYYAPSAAIVQMVEAIVKDSNRVLPAAAWVTGQYGLEDMFIGVPVRLGRNGVEEIVELSLNEKESSDMQSSGAHVREVIEAYQNLPTDDA